MKKQKKYKPVRKKGKSFSLGSDKPTGRAKGYNKDWDIFRRRFIHHNPRCYCCGRHKDDVRIEVDHVIAHKGNDELFWKSDNLIPLCKSCHSMATGMFDRYDVPKTEEKLKWLWKQRNFYGCDVVVKVVSTGKEKLNIL